MVLSAIALILYCNQELSPEAKIAAAKQELAVAKAAYLSAKNSNKNLADASYEYGAIVVESPVLSPSEKYPLALALFRQTIKLDPKNTEAVEWEQTIVGIYAGLGKEPTEINLDEIR
ncbi:MAG: hypothetical protein KF836_10130 [Fimbriimonadaceae bacterium]|nr:hypothetical protein [Fimbriimonadaceae bacterium]